jgi:hypothetical protein
MVNPIVKLPFKGMIVSSYSFLGMVTMVFRWLSHIRIPKETSAHSRHGVEDRGSPCHGGGEMLRGGCERRRLRSVNFFLPKTMWGPQKTIAKTMGKW